MRIGAAQIDCQENETESNIKNIAAILEKGKDAGLSLLLFPELSTSGYFLNTIENTAIASTSEVFNTISTICKELSIDCIVGLPFRDGESIYNVLTHFSSNGTSKVIYKKTHLFHGESPYFSSGDSLKVFTYGEYTCAPLICYDLRFSDLFTIYRKAKAGLFFVSAAWPKVRVEHWITLLKARAIETQSYIVASNRCGKDHDIVMAGNSMIINPYGEVLSQLSQEEGILWADIDNEIVESCRETYPFFPDRREDLYCSQAHS